jgi:hypothetical protein
MQWDVALLPFDDREVARRNPCVAVLLANVARDYQCLASMRCEVGIFVRR